jgi:pimeloyl-ACP methyl ester carboxylesterase
MKARWIALAAAVALAALLAVNTVLVDNETKRAHADVGRIVHLPDGDLQVREDGPPAAPAMVLLHGFAGSIHWWDGVVGALGAHHRLIRIDLLGHGGSAKPRHGYTMEHQAQLVDEALSQLGVRRALVVGHSMGGTVATALAQRDRRLVAGVVLIDTPPTQSAGKLPFIARLGFVPMLGQALRRLVSDGLVRNGLEDAFAPGYPVPRQFVTDFRQMTFTSYDASHSDVGSYGRRESLDRRLAAAATPLLVLYGTRDRIVETASMHDYLRVPGARVVAIPAAGHSPMVEKPAATGGEILGFARALAKRAAA